MSTNPIGAASRLSVAASALVFALALIALTISAKGQAVTIIHNFVATDGTNPFAGLTQSSNGTLYGTTANGGNNGQGSLYEIDPLGNETVLHSFLDPNVPSDGYSPYAPVTQAANGNFYGTTIFGGTDANGIVYELSSQGQYTVLHNFGDGSVTNDGMKPQARIIQGADGLFYGITTLGGSTANEPNGGGTVFQMTPAGGITIIHAFADGSVANDGINPIGGLVQGPDGTLYGAAPYNIFGGTSGSIFSVTPQGVYAVLHRFADGSVQNDGATPNGDLVQGADGNFYGTTEFGGSRNDGTVYKITPQGQVTILHSFLDGSIMNDGTFPTSGLVLASDGNFYGMTSAGGALNLGTIFKVTPQGAVTILHSFMDGTIPSDGFQSSQSATGQLVQGSDGNLYGATHNGGGFGYGTVFQVRLGVPALVGPVNANATSGVPFTFPLLVTNSPTAYVSSTLPSGLSINQTTGVISGTPTAPGTFPVLVTLTNANGSNQVPITITVAPPTAALLTSSPAAYGTVGVPFTYVTTASASPTAFADGGEGSPTLPPGLSIDPNSGIISGTPTVSGAYAVSLLISNAQGNALSQLTITISSSPATPSQEYNVLHTFGRGNPQYDGSTPTALLQAFDGTFWGATSDGGQIGGGTLFNMIAQGSDSIAFSFGSSYGASGVPTAPGALIQGSDGNFYSIATDSATNAPTLSKITPQGVQTLVCSLNNPNTVGFDPPAGSLMQASDGNFYGTMNLGGSGTEGVVYKVTPQGVVTVLHSFSDVNRQVQDALNPGSGLIQGTDGNLYGTTVYGGTGNQGTVYKITPLGVMTILHSFNDTPSTTVKDVNGNQVEDGQYPVGALIQGADGNFYGTTFTGGYADQGTVFQMTPQGVVTIVHSFADGSVTLDGINPYAGLVQGYDGNFYGTTHGDQSTGFGTVFQVTPQGQTTILHYFQGGADGSVLSSPVPLIQATDGNLYGLSTTTTFAILAKLSPTQKPIFSGAAYAASSLGTPLSFTPKALFGASGNGAGANLIKAAAGVHPNTDATSWILTGSLPNLLSFNSTTGAISGIPLVSGRFTVTLTPTNSVGSGTPTSVTLYIDVPPDITSAHSAAAGATNSFSYTITGDALPTGYDATRLPGWLSLDPTTGLITGTPPSGGTYAFNVAAENFAGVGTQQVVLSVTGGTPGSPVVTSATTASAMAGTPFTYQITATNSPTTFTALTLPVGLTVNSQTGTISGTPTTAGTYSIPITAANTTGTTASEVTITVGTAGAPVLNGPLAATAVVDTAFSYQVPATGLVATYSALGLPSGLTIDPASGIISGTPTVAGGPTAVTVLAANGSGTVQATLSLTIASETGSVQVTLSPDDANNNGAQWSVDGGTFQSSGATVSGLGAGPHTLTFSPVSGYTTPASQAITVTADQTATASVNYATPAPTGSLQVTLGPSDAVSAGALWSVDGGATQASGATVNGLSVGSHTVTFTSTLGYTTPASQMVTVSASQTATATATYVAATGSLKVTLSLSGAATAGAQWSVDDGPLQNSGATVGGLGVGSHTVVFTSVTGYTAPSSQTVAVFANSTAAATGVYTGTPTGSLQVNLTPSSAISVGAQWEVDGGSLQNSGSTVSGLSVGSHTVVFNSVGGFLTPASHSVTVAANKTTSATGTYTDSGLPEITSSLSYTGFSTLSFTYQATASHSPTKFYATGLPKGATLNATTGAIACKSVAVGSYSIVLSASNAIGTGSPSTLAMTIVAGPPTVASSAATGIGAEVATLNGTVNPKGGDTMAFFQYGPTTAYGTTTTAQDMGAGSANVTFHASLTGLAPATAYHFRAVALKQGGYLYGADETFKTLAMPVIPTNPATPLLSASGALVGFAVNPNGVATSAYIAYSTDPAFGTYSQTTPQSIGSGKTAVNFTAFLSGLQPGTIYYYVVVTTGPAGTFYSAVQSFTTLGFDVTQVIATGQGAPGTAFNFASFGNAAIDSQDGAAFGAKISSTSTASNAGIWANQGSITLTLIAQTGSTAPGTGGAVFATLGDPVYNNNEDVAFGGTLKVATGLVTTANETGVWASNSFTLGLLAREGGTAPGTGGATFASFGAVRIVGRRRRNRLSHT